MKDGENVLDCGCGAGQPAGIAKYVVGDGRQVPGIDPSLDQLNMADRKAGKGNLYINFYKASIDELPLLMVFRRGFQQFDASSCPEESK